MPWNTAPPLAAGYKGACPTDSAAVAVRSIMLTVKTSGLTAAAGPWRGLLLALLGALLALLGVGPAAAAPFPVHLVVNSHKAHTGERPWQEYPVAINPVNGSFKPILPGTDHGLYNEGFFEGDIVGTKHTSAINDPDTKNAVRDPNLLWPSATVVYKVDDDVGCPESPQCTILMEAMEHYHRHTCIRFKQWTGEDNWVSIFFNSDSSGACWSPVGRVGDGEQRLSLGQRCWYKGIVIHELGHAIGFWHEMNRPDRDDWIYVYWQNIIPGFASAFKKHAQVNTLGEHFDYRSIMMYDEYAFSKDGRSPTLQATTGEEIGPIWKKKGLSGSDKRRIEKLYKCDLKKPMAGFPYNVNCDFNRHVCGFKNGGTPNWSWRTVNQTDGYVYTSFDVAGTTPGHFMSINFPPISEALESVRGELGCVRFYYLIETDGEAQLFLDQAYLKTSTQLNHDQDTTFELWANNTSSNEWIHMEIPLYVTRPFKLIFTSVFNGTATHGTIALDDVELLYTPCNPPATTTPSPTDGEGVSSTTPAVMPSAPRPKPTTAATTTTTTTTSTSTTTTTTTTPAPSTTTPSTEDTSSPSSTSTSTSTEALSGISSYMTTAEAEEAIQQQQLQQQQSILHAQQLLEQQQQKEQQQQLLAIAQQLQQHVTASGHHSARDPPTTTPRPTSTTFPTYETVSSTTDTPSETTPATESTTTADPDFPISLLEPFDSSIPIPNLPTPTDQMDMKPSTVSVLNYDESEDGR